MTLRDIAIALGFKVDESKAKEAENRISDLKGFAVKALGAIGIGFSLAAMNQLAEEFNGINDQIRNATRELGDQRDIQQQILRSAQETRSEYGTTAKYVSMMVKENSEMFAGVEDAIAYNDVLTKMWKAAGRSNDEINGLMEAVNKSFAKGKVDTETLNRLLEQSPEAVEYLNKHLGSTTDQLEQMLADGKIGLTDLRDAFLENTDDIERKFGELNYSISDGLLHIRNRWGLWLDDLNSSTLFTETLSKYMVRAFDWIMTGLDKARDGFVWLTERLGGIENVLKLLGILIAGIVIATQGNKVISVLQTVLKLVGGINLKILGIIAIFVVLALLVDDFINFMKGNDSVIGEALRAAGIDADAMREKIIGAWNGCKEAAGQLVEALRPLWDLLSRFWGDWGDDILAVVGMVLAGILGAIIEIINVLSGLLTFLTGVFTGDWDKALEGLNQMWDSFWNGLYKLFEPVITLIDKLFGDKIDSMIGYAKKLWEKVQYYVSLIGNAFGGIVDFIGGIGEGIGNFFGGSKKTSVQNSTINQSAGNGGNRTNNVNQNVEINNTFKGMEREQVQVANRMTTDVVSDLNDAFVFER